jgi:hypothetical protein
VAKKVVNKKSKPGITNFNGQVLLIMDSKDGDVESEDEEEEEVRDEDQYVFVGGLYNSHGSLSLLTLILEPPFLQNITLASLKTNLATVADSVSQEREMPMTTDWEQTLSCFQNVLLEIHFPIHFTSHSQHLVNSPGTVSAKSTNQSPRSICTFVIHPHQPLCLVVASKFSYGVLPNCL